MIPKNSTSSNKSVLNNAYGPLHKQQLHENETGYAGQNPKDPGQQTIHADMQMLQSPIFNIHIHVPPYKGDNLKLYLPRIQPVIHLHFDELAKGLQINREEQSQEATYRAFQNLLSKTAPKFGGVKFHYENKSNEVVISESELGRTTPSSENYSTDTDVNMDENLELIEVKNSDNGEIINCCGNHNSSTNSNKGFDISMNESNSNNEETSSQKLKKKFGLKEPVVVLTDICKTTYYKYMVAAGYIKDVSQEYESESDALSDRDENAGREESAFFENEECKDSYIKTEVCSPESASPCTARKNVETVSGLNTSDNRSCTHSIEQKKINSVSNSEKTLTDLAEGCNFSDILNRFQFKISGDFAKHKDDTLESGVCCMLKNNEECHCESHKRFQELSYPKNRLNINQDNTDSVEITQRQITSRNTSQNFENGPHCQDFSESIVSKDVGVFCRSPNKYKPIREDTAFQPQSNKTNDSEPFSDDGNIAAERQQASNEVPLDSSNAFSPSKASNTQQNCELPQTKGDSSVNLGISHLTLNIIRKAMKEFLDNERPKLKKKLTESFSSSPEVSSLPKKMKHSDAESNKTDCKTKTSTVVEDYIPLEASGPTKFAVASLNKINPHKSHSARNFKKEMLFGNKVKRFSSSDHLRIYQLKQKAGKSQSN